MKKAIICLGLGLASVESTFLKCAEDKVVSIPVAKDCNDFGYKKTQDCGCGDDLVATPENDCGCDDNINKAGCTSFGEISNGCFGNQITGNNNIAVAQGNGNAFQYGLNGFTNQENNDNSSNAIPSIGEVRLPGEQNIRRNNNNEIDECDETNNELPRQRGPFVAGPNVSAPNNQQRVYLNTNQNDRTLQAQNNNNYANTVNNAANYNNQAGQAANNNQSYQAAQNDAAQYVRGAATNKSDEEIKNSNRAKNVAALKYNAGNTNKNLQKKNKICHAKDNAFHKEEHVANEQKFCHQDEGNVETVECTHICENTFKDKCKNEKADRQIWKKIETCASKTNHKKASAKALHKACHKKSDKNAFKQANHCQDKSCDEKKCHDASSGKTQDECDSIDKESSAASSNNNASSSNTANSAQVNNAASSNNSALTGASSANYALSADIAQSVNASVNGQRTTPIIVENENCGC